METVLKLFKMVGTSPTPFPNANDQIEIYDFESNADRMGGAPFISAKVKFDRCLEDEFDENVFVTFEGEKYYAVHTPSMNKDNSDTRYQHEVQFVSERKILENIYFIDAVQENEMLDRPKSNTNVVQFMGDIYEFVQRLNSSLIFSKVSYKVVVDSFIKSEIKLVSFSSKYVSEALQEAFNIFGIPFYYEGKTIHFGYVQNDIATPIRYGRNDALLSISKNNANYKVINRITGVGGQENIPFYYPNMSPNRADVEANGGTWITPSPNLMPPIYRESKGKERFYNAENGKYTDENGDMYKFENPFVEGKPIEGITDFPEIRPTIEGMTNRDGERIDMFLDFEYDLSDNDEFDESTNEYKHPYFFAKLRRTYGQFEFNLFSAANEKQTMVIAMKKGVCGACQFEIGIGEKTQKNIVQVDSKGNLIRDRRGNVLRSGAPQPQQNDTINNEVWIALKKDINTYHSFSPMPNVRGGLRPSIEDNFVILGITLPDGYIRSAEKKLEQSLIKHMFLNNFEKFNFDVRFSRIYLQENPDVMNNMNENSRINIEFNGKLYPQFINSITRRVSSNSSLPEINVTLTDTLNASKNSLETTINSIKEDIMSSFGGSGNFLKLGMKHFLRKDAQDVAEYMISFFKGAEFGKFVRDKNGAKIDALGNLILQSIKSHKFSNGALGQGFELSADPNTGKSYLEVDNLFVRVAAFFTKLEIKKLSYAGGNYIFSPAGMLCSKVEELTNSFKCYFVNKNEGKKVENEFRVDDLVRCQEFNMASSGGVSKNRYYWRRCISTGEDFIELSKTDMDSSSNAEPMVGDTLVCLGNKSDTTRQNAIIISAYGEGSPSLTQHTGINTYSLADTEKTLISPKLNKFTGEFVFSNGTNVSSEIEKANQSISKQQEAIDANSKEIAKVADDLSKVQPQEDGSIDFWFGETEPTLQNEPAVSWIEKGVQDKHISDMYYSKSDKVYRFDKIADNKYAWSEVKDPYVKDALKKADEAKLSADGKVAVFLEQPKDSQSYKVGDLWLNATYPKDGKDKGSVYENDLLRCETPKTENQRFDISHWKKAAGYTDDKKADQALKEAQNAKNEAYNANATAEKAKQDAILANNAIKDMADDNKLSPSEKKQTMKEWDIIKSEEPKNVEIAKKYGVNTDSYVSAYNSLNAYLTPLLASLTTTSEIVGTTFRKNFKIYYDNRTDLLNLISTEAKVLADNAQLAADNAQKLANASKTRLDNWAKDGVISPTEKYAVAQERKRIEADYNDVMKEVSEYNTANANISTVAFSLAYAAYSKQLEIHSTFTSETFTIRPELAASQNAYFKERNNILSSISKKIIADFKATNNSITASVTATKKELDGRINTTQASLKVVEGKVETEVKERIALGNIVSQNTASIQTNTEGIKTKASQTSLDQLSGRVTKAESEITQTPQKISLAIKNIEIGGVNLYSSQTPISVLNSDGSTTTNRLVSQNKNGFVAYGTYENISYAYIFTRLQDLGDYSISFRTRAVSQWGCNLYATYRNKEGGITNKKLAYVVFSDNTSQVKSYTFTISENDFGSDLNFYLEGMGAQDYYITDLMIEKGNKPSSWVESPIDGKKELLDTGIDIENKKITVTSDNFIVKDNKGVVNTMFYTSSTGLPIMKSDFIDATNIKVRKIEAATGTFSHITSPDTKQMILNSKGIYFFKEEQSVIRKSGLGIDGGVLPSTAGASAAIGSVIENNYKYSNGLGNLASYFSASGLDKQSDTKGPYGNCAIMLGGGSIYNFKIRTRRVDTSETLDILDGNIISINMGGTITINLPNMGSTSKERWANDGKVIYVTQVGQNGKCVIKGSLYKRLQEVTLEYSHSATFVYDGSNDKWTVMTV